MKGKENHMDLAEKSTQSGIDIRPAGAADIPILASHHKKMFEEIWRERGDQLDSAKADEIENAYARKLSVELESGICRAWVAEEEGGIVSSGAITISSFVPNPSDLSSRVAYLHSMFTEVHHRNRHCARRIILSAMAFCRENGIKRMLLNSSAAGQPLYRKMGFLPVPDAMRIFL